MSPSSFGPGPIDPQGAFSPPPPPPGGAPPKLPPMPPGYVGPPVYMMAPPPPPPKGKSFARAIFMTLATTIFGVSLLLNLYLLMISGILHAKDMQHETVVEKGDLTSKIVILTVDGVINEKSAQAFRKQLKSLEDDAAVKAIVLEVDSPGGSVTASDEIYHDLMNYKAKFGKPVVVSQGSLAASGGYYISCAGDVIIAQPTTLDDLAQLAGYTPQHLNRTFRRELGVTPLQHLTKLRMEHAAALLAEGKLTVKAIASAVACEDPYYFSRQFRQHFGRSPVQYRIAAGSNSPS